MAILQYLDEKYPTPALFPKSSKDKALVWQLCETINSGIQPLQNLNVLQWVKTQYGVDPQDWSHKWIEKGLIALERQLQTTAGTFCLGGHITAADLCLVPQVYNAHRFKVNMDQLPKIQKIYEACEKLEAFKLAHPSKQPDSI